MIVTQANESSTTATAPVIAFPTQQLQRQRKPIIEPANQQLNYSITNLSQTWLDPVIKRLNELVGLRLGWDGYKAIPVTFENAFFAIEVLKVSCGVNAPTPQIVPGVSGDLQIEWHLENGDIELHIRAPNDVQAWHADTNSSPEGEGILLTNDFTTVARWIKNLTEPPSAIRATAS